jgi:hypothetical protein
MYTPDIVNVPFIEPVSPKYIKIEKESNHVYLLTPVISGQEISTDNTCKAMVELKHFFDGGALDELNAYKDALEFDIQLLSADSPERASKEGRLTQIYTYIEALNAMRYSYNDAMTAFLTRPSNLYSIQLRPRLQDSLSRVVNPVFTIERRNDDSGIPLSSLYNAMHSAFPRITIAPLEPRAQLTTAVLANLPAEPSIADIQVALAAQCQRLFGLTIDFTHQADGTVVDQEAIDTIMQVSEANPATSQDYIDNLLGMCAADIWESITTPPFYSIPEITQPDERTERLSILTQFFLANTNIYCKARGISTQNFGAILDASLELSNELVGIVATTLSRGDDVEERVLAFINAHHTTFGLNRPLTPGDVEEIRQKFARTYRTITATPENPHTDDFMILDKDTIGEVAKSVIFQGRISVNFADLVDPIAASINPAYFDSIRADFAGLTAHSAEIPHGNDLSAGHVTMDIETLLTRITHDEQLELLPQPIQALCKAHPSFTARHFAQDVAKGRQVEAVALLTSTPANTQTLLRTPSVFTDYSGRTFNCTAYEYAYWAKDTHMCRMLESHMDEETKAFLLTRVDEIESNGLEYLQQGRTHRTNHFDLTPLKEALRHYRDGWDNWHDTSNWDAMTAAWLEVGKAQRDVPAHIAQEYCRPDGAFSTIHITLPRVFTFYHSDTGSANSWFPLVTSDSGLGFNFALLRGAGQSAATGLVGLRGPGWSTSQLDLTAVTRLDEVRTADLGISREHLNPPEMSRGIAAGPA